MAGSSAPGVDAAFAEAMARLEPFEPNPNLTVAVSGGADSMALALLAQDWVRSRQGTLRALVVDHGLRPEAAAEASLTISRLGGMGIAANLLRLTALRHGSALAERARIMRLDALAASCRSGGSLHLLLGHHAADQAETMMMRALGRSLTHGMAAMPALSEHTGIRLLRPLLTIRPEALRRLLQGRGVEWVEDPSNHDLKALRPRLRHRMATHMSADGMADLAEAAGTIGNLRADEEAAAAAELASRATLRPEGFALLAPGRIGAAALASLIRTISGAAYAPSLSRIAHLAARPRPATIAGVRLLPAGRLGDGLLVAREEAATAEPMNACPDVVWDGRFRLIADGLPLPGMVVGKLGQDAASFRAHSTLPSVVLRTLPALRLGETLAAVPHLGYAADKLSGRVAMLFNPRRPVAGATFMPASSRIAH